MYIDLTYCTASLSVLKSGCNLPLTCIVIWWSKPSQVYFCGNYTKFLTTNLKQHPKHKVSSSTSSGIHRIRLNEVWQMILDKFSNCRINSSSSNANTICKPNEWSPLVREQNMFWNRNNDKTTFYTKKEVCYKKLTTEMWETKTNKSTTEKQWA